MFFFSSYKKKSNEKEKGPSNGNIHNLHMNDKHEKCRQIWPLGDI